MCVGDLPTIVGIEIGGIQKFRIGKMIGEIVIGIHTGIDLRGTRNRIDRDDRGLESPSGRYQFQNRGPSENFNRGDRRQGGRRNCLRVRVDQNDEVNPPIMHSALCIWFR
ncbi:hypothetical protein TNCV_4282051 [Trichonephila clavipes]|nr:hypothetical protein TNCV_4282051 [Trichonephila clavipes]